MRGGIRAAAQSLSSSRTDTAALALDSAAHASSAAENYFSGYIDPDGMIQSRPPVFHSLQRELPVRWGGLGIRPLPELPVQRDGCSAVQGDISR